MTAKKTDRPAPHILVDPKLPSGLHVVCLPGESVIGAFEDVTIVDTCDKPTVSQWLDHASLPVKVIGDFRIGDVSIPVDASAHIRIWDSCRLVLTTQRLLFLALTQSADIKRSNILAIERQEGNRFAVHRKRAKHKRWLCFETASQADLFERSLKQHHVISARMIDANTDQV